MATKPISTFVVTIDMVESPFTITFIHINIYMIYLKDYNEELLADVKYLTSEAEKDKRNLAKDNYTESKILFHISNRYENGKFSILYDNDKPIGYAGAYKHTDDVLICGVRLYILPKYKARSLFGNSILPYQMEYAKDNNFKFIWLTFNEYNTWLYKAHQRVAEGKGTIFGHKPNRKIFERAHFYTEEKYIRQTWQKVIEIEIL
jgi:hypothetical protein